MNHHRKTVFIALFAVLAAVLSLTVSLLQILSRLPAVISSVSWNL